MEIFGYKIEKASKPKVPVTPVGIVGMKTSSGYVQEEFLDDLQWPDAGRIYQEMSSNDDMVDGFSGAFSYFRPKIGHFDPPTITRASNRVVDRGEPRVAVRSSGSGSYWHKSMSGR